MCARVVSWGRRRGGSERRRRRFGTPLEIPPPKVRVSVWGLIIAPAQEQAPYTPESRPVSGVDLEGIAEREQVWLRREVGRLLNLCGFFRRRKRHEQRGVRHQSAVPASGRGRCPASQSSTSHDAPAERAVDNAGFSGSWHSASCTHTDIAAVVARGP